MSRKTLKLCRIVIGMGVGASVGWSVAVENAVLPLIAVGVGMGLLYLCKRQLKEVIVDERIHKISEKASRITIAVFGPMIAVAGAVLIALRKNVLAEFEQAGFTLAYSACALALLYYILYVYYERKS